MSGTSRRRPVATATGLAALVALTVSLGIHPATAFEVAAVVVVLLLTVALLRLVPGSVRRERGPGGGGGTGSSADASAIVAGCLRSDWWVQTALRPVVRDVVEARFAASGRPLPEDDAARRRLLPPDVAELVVLGRGPDRSGLTSAQLAALLDQLEELSP